MTSEFVDGLVREFLLFRGFTQSLKAFESDVKSDKDKAFRPDKIADQLLSYVYSQDIQGLRDYWSYLDAKLFSRLEQCYSASTKRLESGLLKLYLVQAHQSGRHERVVEFFERLTPELQRIHEWREWFAFPFVRNPEENMAFSMFFSKTWQETFTASLRNFVSVVIRFMPKPQIARAETDLRRLRSLVAENERLRNQLHGGSSSRSADSVEEARDASAVLCRDLTGADLMDDFAVISQEHNEVSTQQGESGPSSSQTKTIKSFIRTIALPSSPNTSSSSKRAGAKNERKISSPAGPAKPALGKIRSNSNPPESTRPSRPVSVPPAPVVAEAPPESEEATPTTPVATPVTTPQSQEGEPRANPPLPSPPFLLLSQEDYKEHPSSIAHVRFSPTGSHVASVDVDGVVKVWSARAGVTRATIMSKSVMTCIDWVPNGDRMLLHGNRTGAVRLFDLKENKSVSEVPTEPLFPRVHCVACDPMAGYFLAASRSRGRVSATGAGANRVDASASMSRSGILQLFDLRAFKKVLDMAIEPGPAHINCMAWNTAGTRCLAGGSDGVLRLYDLHRKECVTRWQAHKGEIHTVEFSKDERRCFSMGAGDSSSILLWSLSGEKESELSLHPGAGGPFVLSGFGGLKQVHTPKGGLFRFDAERNFFLTCKMNGALLYKIEGDSSSIVTKPQMALGGHKAPVVTLDWTSVGDCSVCATASMDGHIKVSTLLTQTS